MKVLLWIVGGAVVLALGAFAALWIWGTMAFTPPRVVSTVVASGTFEDGVTFEIVRGGGMFETHSYGVTFGTTELGLRYTAVGVEAGGRRPVEVTHPDAASVMVRFERPLANGAQSLVVPLDQQVPTQIIEIDAEGLAAARVAPWLLAPGEEPL